MENQERGKKQRKDNENTLTAKNGYAIIFWYELAPGPSHLDTPTNDLVYGEFNILRRKST